MVKPFFEVVEFSFDFDFSQYLFQMFFENNDSYINIEALENQKLTIIQPMNFQWEFLIMPVYVKHEAA